ncbi:MAG: hypothetical protein WC782_03495 [Methylococcaceae bacterium]
MQDPLPYRKRLAKPPTQPCYELSSLPFWMGTTDDITKEVDWAY